MGKHEPMTAKAIGKKIKSKGLQKLKFYCQMCQKQCRDANGFKCHTSSEAHQRQLLLFAENPNKYLGSYSDDFLKDWLYLLRTRFGTRRVLANTVYQEYIKEKDHIHMNSTRWVTLSGLCKWMGRKGICEVEENEKGWYITYIDRDPETLKRQENLSKKAKLEKDYEERFAKIIEEQIERGKAASTSRTDEDSNDAPKELKRNESATEKIAFKLPVVKLEKPIVIKQERKDPSSDIQQPGPSTSKSSETNPEVKYKIKGEKLNLKRKLEEPSKVKKSALEELKEEEEKLKEKKNRKDNWIIPGIIVKVIHKKLGENYYKKKGEIMEVKDKFEAIVEMLDSGDRLKIDQEYLETVIPNVGKTVIVVNGAYAGSEATLTDVNFDKFCATIQLISGPFKGRKVERISYEDICKKA